MTELETLISDAERLIQQRDENWRKVESMDFQHPKRTEYLGYYTNCIRSLGDLAPRLLAAVKAAQGHTGICECCEDAVLDAMNRAG